MNSPLLLTSNLSAVESVSTRLEVTVAHSAEDLAFCKDRLEAQHSLGDTKAAGHRLWQIVRRDRVPVAVVVWAASALRLKDRDAWIGWDTVTQAKRLKLIVNNTRFLVAGHLDQRIILVGRLGGSSMSNGDFARNVRKLDYSRNH